MMRTLLANPNFKLEGKMNRKFGLGNRIRPPLDLLYIASSIEEETEVKLIDANLENLSIQGCIEQIRRYQPDIVIVTTSPLDRWECPFPILGTPFELVRQIRMNFSKIKIIVTGAHGTVAPEYIFDKCNPDFVIIGEPEIVTRELINSIRDDGNYIKIKGLSFELNGKIIKTPYERIENLDELPFPKYELTDLAKYTHDIFRKSPFTNVLTSRGCPFQCIYCFKGIFGSKYRIRSPKNVFEELKLLHDKYSVKAIHIQDLDFFIKKERTIKICKNIIENSLDIIWSCNARVDMVDKEVLEWAYRAGCRYVTYGVESGSQKILDNIKKGITLEQARKALTLTREVGITPGANMMIGLVGDTKETVMESLKFYEKVHPEGIGTAKVIPYPGTKLYELGVKESVFSGDPKICYDECIKGIGSIGTDVNSDEIMKYIQNRIIKIKYGKYYFSNPKLWVRFAISKIRWRR